MISRRCCWGERLQVATARTRSSPAQVPTIEEEQVIHCRRRYRGRAADETKPATPCPRGSTFAPSRYWQYRGCPEDSRRRHRRGHIASGGHDTPAWIAIYPVARERWPVANKAPRKCFPPRCAPTPFVVTLEAHFAAMLGLHFLSQYEIMAILAHQRLVFVAQKPSAILFVPHSSKFKRTWPLPRNSVVPRGCCVWARPVGGRQGLMYRRHQRGCIFSWRMLLLTSRPASFPEERALRY